MADQDVQTDIHDKILSGTLTGYPRPDKSVPLTRIPG